MEGRELPEGWATARLEEVAEILDSRRIPLNADERKARIEGKKVDELFPYYGATGQVGWIDDFLFDEQLILLGEDGVSFFDPLRHKAYLASGKFWVNNHAHVLRGINGLADQSYLTSYFNQLDYTGFVSGSTRLKLTQAAMKGIPVPLAPLNEQRRIAAKLDTTIAAVEACRQRLDGVAAILKRFRQAVLAAATTGELTREWREVNGKSLDDWTARTVGDVVTDIQAGLNVQCEERPPADNERGLVKISAVTWGTYNEDESKTLKPDQQVLERNRIRPGDFLISRANTIELVGSCVIVHEARRALYLSDKVLRLVMPEEWKLWLLMCLRSENGRRQIVDLASGNQLSMRNLSQKNLLSIKILLPPKHELDQVKSFSNRLFDLADQLEAKLIDARRIVERLTPALLAKAFRGELVPQDPSDEPASVLLEKIRAARQSDVAVGKSSRRGGRNAGDSLQAKRMPGIPDLSDHLPDLLGKRTDDETDEGEGSAKEVLKSYTQGDQNFWSTKMSSLLNVLEKQQQWILASQVATELGISDGASSEEVEQFFWQLKEQIEAGMVEVERRDEEDWLRLSNGAVV
jgi:type I restriction enzyme S subunit